MFCYCFEYSNIAYCILYIILCECSECVIDNGKSCIKGCTVRYEAIFTVFLFCMLIVKICIGFS